MAVPSSTSFPPGQATRNVLEDATFTVPKLSEGRRKESEADNG